MQEGAPRRLRIVFGSGADSISTPAWRRRRPRDDDTEAWRDPDFTLRTASWWYYPLAAAEPASTKRARVTTVSDAIILGLPEVTDRSGEECAICLNDFRAEETLRAMPCAHAFHHNCIAQWLRRNAVCPLCRHQLLPTTPTTPEEEEDQEVPTAPTTPEEGEDQEEEDDLEWVDGGIVIESS
ncbi:unnamed protein product [Urochloa humidicola]